MGGFCDEKEDRLIWKKSGAGKVTTKTFIDRFYNPLPSDPKFGMIWQSWLPLKVSCFLWKALKSALATDDRVRSLGIPIPSKCCCCFSPEVESLEHLLFCSNLASVVWDCLCPIFKRQRPKSIHEFLYYWGISRNFRKFIDCLAFGVAACALWDVWKCRNARRFEGQGCVINKWSIIRWAGTLSKLISKPCVYDNESRSICNSLHIVATLAPEFKVHWRRWEPSFGGNSCNIAFRITDLSSTMAAIMRDRCGRFLYAMKTVSIPKSFLKCLLQVMSEIHIAGFNIVAVKTSCVEIGSMGKHSEVLWQDFQTKRRVARMCHNVEVYRVCPAVNRAADCLCWASVVSLSTASFSSLPAEVQDALINDSYDRPCSFLDQRIFV